VVGYFNGAYV